MNSISMCGIQACLYGKLKGCIKSMVAITIPQNVQYADLHLSTGPIVRINPLELHVNDIEFYDEIYASGSRQRDVYDFSRRGLDAPLALGGTVKHDLHRHRRDALNPFFSKENVTKLEPLIQDKVNLLCDRISNVEQPIVLSNAFMALTVDIIGQFAFGKNYGYLDRPDFGAQWRSDTMTILKNSKLLTHCYWLVVLMKILPESVVNLLAPPAVKDLLAYKKVRLFNIVPARLFAFKQRLLVNY